MRNDAGLKLFIPVLLVSAILTNDAFSSTIVDAEGYACMGYDKSRKDTEKESLNNARRNALENAGTYIRSETSVQDFVLQKDTLDAYAHGTVKIIGNPATAWYADPSAGDCVRTTIRAEVLPDARYTADDAALQKLLNSPTGPLIVNMRTDKPTYSPGEKVKVYLKGNKPFYAVILYKTAEGGTLQILPNPHRTDNYFQPGEEFLIPGAHDEFELEVTPPYGRETFILYASTTQVGELELSGRKDFYLVKTGEKDFHDRSRGIALKPVKDSDRKFSAGEFVESRVEIKIVKRK